VADLDGAAELPFEIDCRAVKQMLDEGADFLLLDCREQDEFETVSIAGATLLPMSQLMDRVSELAPHQHRRIVIHCHLGHRSLHMTRWLRQQGYRYVQSMSGGVDQWAVEIEPGLPRY